MAYDLPAVPYWQPALGVSGAVVTGIDELSQAIKIILSTPKGTIPHRPEFGCDLLGLVDNPQVGMTAKIVRLVTDAIETWEPRVKVSSVEVDSSTYGASTLRVYWYPKGTTDGTKQSTELVYLTTDMEGAPGGAAPLDESGIIPTTNLPGVVLAGKTIDVPASADGGEIK